MTTWLTNAHKNDVERRATGVWFKGTAEVSPSAYLAPWAYIARPKATHAHTTEELEAMGYVGVYRDDPTTAKEGAMVTP